MNEPIIDPEFSQFIPALTEEEFAQLEANIVRDGCIEPLTVWEGILIDGHNRLRICEKHALQYKTHSIEFVDRTEAKLWMIERQFGRRNLTPFQMVELNLIHKKVEAERVQVAANEKRALSAQGKLPQTFGDVPSDVPVDKHENETRAILGERAHVSHETVRKCERIIEKASPETLEALRRGDRSINDVFREVSGKKPFVTQNTGENEWYTPQYITDMYRELVKVIDLDPASCEDANRIVRATRIFTSTDDGLKQSWTGNVWLNPPYAVNIIKHFVAKFKTECSAIANACILVNNATETEWFQDLAAICACVCFPKSRIRFWSASGAGQSPLQGQALFYYGDLAKEFVALFGDLGVCYLKQPREQPSCPIHSRLSLPTC